MAATTLKDYKPAEGSKLVLVKIENTSRSDAAQAIEEIKKQEVTSLDVVVANDGINPLDALLVVKYMDADQLYKIFDVEPLVDGVGKPPRIRPD